MSEDIQRVSWDYERDTWKVEGDDPILLEALEVLKGMTFEKVYPSRADGFLKLNYTGQRKLRPNDVFRYASDMKTGQWNELQLDPISITNDNQLINGQHRFSAEIRADVPVYYFFNWNAKVDEYKTMDSGVRRKLSDRLNIYGGDKGTAIARRAYCVDHGASCLMALRGSYPTAKSAVAPGHRTKGATPTEMDLQSYIESNYDYLDELARTSIKLGAALNREAPRIVGTFLHVLHVCGYDMQAAIWAECAFETPYGLASIQNLHNSIVQDYSKKRSGQAVEQERLMRLFYCFNAYLKGDEIKSFPPKAIRDALMEWDSRLCDARHEGDAS